MNRLRALSANIAPISLLVLVFIGCALIDGRILAPANLMIILTQSVPILILALGAFIVLLTGGIDLSAGVSVTLGSIVIASMLTTGANLFPALAAGLVCVVVIGIANGTLVTLFRVPAFITTLATMSCIQGISLLLATRGVYVINEPALKWLGTGRVEGIPVSILVAIIVICAAYVLMHHTRVGLRTYATGSDPTATALANISTSRVLMLAYVIAACFTFLAAVMLIARTPIVTPNLGGQSLLLDAIAACVLGGVSIFGGRGTVLGVVAGSLIVSLFANALRVIGVDPSSIDLMKGALVISALVCDVGIARLRGGVLKEESHDYR
ncbi:ribose/xylose/arabinose/galactoside ABC-type transport system permease subunit [Rhizobium azooxidifex]|uniref:Ribose/xylose/arabinose/galactoside ABC-type transport system permease subunit n=1 Tax=Mycoplana azooxidifex TaxID=1636188 RepID=A0A7W6DIX9_9HYPH|nr:ABC transporter permease [Mycoplana azooxidifex]MBB3979889.1 ribose/xylose/arabinose/galactoside ABC-type transport system permease subunit [Mycoplana azooxidifex]